MPIPWQDISSVQFTEWKTARETIAEGIVQCVPEYTRVYPNWIYKIDVQTLLGKVTAAMKMTDGNDAGKIHCWTIGIADAKYVKNQQGVPDLIGAFQWKWNIVLDIWGFFSYDGTKEQQQAAENEARLISAFLWRNSINIVAGVPGLSRIGPLEFGGVQPTPFSDGSDVIVASGSMPIEISEAMTV